MNLQTRLLLLHRPIRTSTFTFHFLACPNHRFSRMLLVNLIGYSFFTVVFGLQLSLIIFTFTFHFLDYPHHHYLRMLLVNLPNLVTTSSPSYLASSSMVALSSPSSLALSRVPFPSGKTSSAPILTPRKRYSSYSHSYYSYSSVTFFTPTRWATLLSQRCGRPHAEPSMLFKPPARSLGPAGP